MLFRRGFLGLIWSGILLSTSVLAGVATTTNKVTLDEQVRELINRHGLTGDPAAGRVIPSINSPEAQLGKLLFFNKGLGGDKDSACITCHSPLLGGGDDLSLSIGVGATFPDLLGPGRRHKTGQPNVPRNALTTFNTVLFDSVMFWDGRVESLSKVPGANGEGGGIRTPDSPLGVADPLAGSNLLHAQARFPVTSKEEMRSKYLAGESNQTLRESLAGRLGGYKNDGTSPLPQPQYWIGLFESVYGKAASPKELITEQRISRAIGEYERSQLFVNNPWNAYVKGNNRAINTAAKRGALLFYRGYTEGGANCAACHTGDRFTDEKFYNIAVPQLGFGTRGGINNTGDIGRANETKRSEDMYTFRTPSLLNVEGTGPYSHTGAYLTLKDMIKHVLNPTAALQNYNVNKVQRLNPGIEISMMQSNTQLAYYYYKFAQISGRNPLREVQLTDRQVNDLIAFLRTLTDPCIKSATCLAPWLDVPNDPNGLMLNPVFQQR